MIRNRHIDILVIGYNDEDIKFVKDMLTGTKDEKLLQHTILTGNREYLDSSWSHEYPDVVIMDMGSREIHDDDIRCVAERLKGVAMVMLVSKGDPDMISRAFNLGVQEVLDRNDVTTIFLWQSINYAYTRKRMELAMRIDRESLDKANSILQVTSDISRRILDGQACIEEMMSIIGTNLNIDGVAVFCDKCLCNGKPHCYWTGGKVSECSHVSLDCRGEQILSEAVSGFIKYNLPVFTRISDMPEPIRTIVSSIGFNHSNKVVIVPIMMDHEPWGIFCFYTLGDRAWSVAEMDALATLSRLGGAIIRNKQLDDEMVEEVHERFLEINRLLSGQVRVLHGN